ncbi:flavoprotein [Streptodolium elevatio]|uniref:Flavoprotein n=1 Tax=Streptodolium elevatio TaxID=3157996 RepID=A0ABV3DXW0_9ACTN
MPQPPVLHVIAGAAPPVLEIAHALRLIRAWGWDPCLTLTPTAARWLEKSADDIAEAAGRHPRTAERLPGEEKPFPAASAVLAAPLTFNTLNKWTSGISDNVALGGLNEALGAKLPMVAAPYFNTDLAAHPRYPTSASLLRRAGVRLVTNGEGAPMTLPGTSWWEAVLRELPGRP